MSTYTREVTFQNDPREEPRTYAITRTAEDDIYEINRRRLISEAEAHANRECGFIAPKWIFDLPTEKQAQFREDWRILWSRVFLSKMNDLCRERGI